ncbi:hypothetical protein WJ968_18705 [Achromobacter xylosoxidans]
MLLRQGLGLADFQRLAAAARSTSIRTMPSSCRRRSSRPRSCAWA